jgi:predicted nucleic acid-binding protein
MKVLTNVVSETMRAQPHAAVLAWLDAQDPSALMTACRGSRLMSGVALPDGARKQQLAHSVAAMLDRISPGSAL